MTREEKQLELERYKALVLATLDFLRERLAGSIVFDHCDHISAYYDQQKIQTEKYFGLRRLDRLQQRFKSLTKDFQYRQDWPFEQYVKEKTGYDIEIPEIDAMPAKATTSKGGGYSEVIGSYEENGDVIEVIRVSSGPRPKHFEELEVPSPDGRCILHVTQQSDGKHSSTDVAIRFATISGVIYSTEGIHPQIIPWWKDNHTIVIETSGEYEVHAQYKHVRSFNDSINIEYVEHSPFS